MKVIEKGHIYEIINREPENGCGFPETQTITFINKEPGNEHEGTTTQEMLRVLIDRTRHCANCMPHRNNEQAIYHLRMALVLHEARALERKLEKGDYAPEYVEIEDDGHFAFMEVKPGVKDTPVLDPFRHDWDRPCNHPIKEKKMSTQDDMNEAALEAFERENPNFMDIKPREKSKPHPNGGKPITELPTTQSPRTMPKGRD